MAVKKYSPTTPARRFMTLLIMKSYQKLNLKSHYWNLKAKMGEETHMVGLLFVTKAAE